MNKGVIICVTLGIVTLVVIIVTVLLGKKNEHKSGNTQSTQTGLNSEQKSQTKTAGATSSGQSGTDPAQKVPQTGLSSKKSSPDQDSTDSTEVPEELQAEHAKNRPQILQKFIETLDFMFFERIKLFFERPPSVLSMFGSFPNENLSKRKNPLNHIDNDNLIYFDEFNQKVYKFLSFVEKKLEEEIKKSPLATKLTFEEKRKYLLLKHKIDPLKLPEYVENLKNKYADQWWAQDILDNIHLFYFLVNTKPLLQFVNDFERDEYFTLRKGLISFYNFLMILNEFETEKNWIDTEIKTFLQNTTKWLNLYKNYLENKSFLCMCSLAFFNLKNLVNIFTFRSQKGQRPHHRQVFDSFYLPILSLSDIDENTGNIASKEIFYDDRPAIVLLLIKSKDPKNFDKISGTISISDDKYKLTSIHRVKNEKIKSYFATSSDKPEENTFVLYNGGRNEKYDKSRMREEVFDQRKGPFLVVYERDEVNV